MWRQRDRGGASWIPACRRDMEDAMQLLAPRTLRIALAPALAVILAACTTGTVVETDEDGQEAARQESCDYSLSVDTDPIMAQVPNVEGGVVTVCLAGICEKATIPEGTMPPPGSSHDNVALRFRAAAGAEPAWSGRISVSARLDVREPCTFELSLSRNVTREEANERGPVRVQLVSAGYVSLDEEATPTYSTPLAPSAACP